MAKIRDILADASHRSVALPKGRWQYYQEWNHVLFFHWSVPVDAVKALIPENLDLDLFDGQAWISLVPFTMQNIRPRFLPAFAPVSDFHEINLRTYVVKDGKPGVYFLNIEAQKAFSAFLSRQLSGLPYEKASIRRSQGKYVSANASKKLALDVEFSVGAECVQKTDLEKFLTERYALYLERGGQLFRYDIHHKEWKIKTLNVRKLHLQYQFPGLDLAGKQPDFAHYSDGVEVVAWKKTAV